MSVEPDLHFDVLVVGAGNAGLCAALAAEELGARVGVLEKAPREFRGGNSALTGHMRFAFNSVDDIAPLINDPYPSDLQNIAEHLPHRTEAELFDEIMTVTDGYADTELADTHVSKSYETVRWLRSKGHDWVPIYATATHGGNVVMMNGGGHGFQERSFGYLEGAGVPIYYDTSATELIEDKQGRVIGLRALSPDGYRTIHASSVVLSCGGFESNAEMRARYLGPGWDTVKMRGVPYNTGDGLLMAMGIGAMPYGSWTTCHASPQDMNRPAYTLPGSGSRGWNRYSYPFSIMVNVYGERFADEAFDVRGRTYARMGRSILAQPAGTAFQILDAKARKMQLLPEYDQASGAKAGTLEELADKLGVDPEGLVRTVREFNAAVQPGEYDPSPYRTDGKRTEGLGVPKSNYAVPIDEPPYEGFGVICGITFTYGGLKVDPKTAQVQHVAGRPIPGLYTSGEMLGGLWHTNYASGSGMMAGSTYGRISGISAAKAALGE